MKKKIKKPLSSYARLRQEFNETGDMYVEASEELKHEQARNKELENELLAQRKMRGVAEYTVSTQKDIIRKQQNALRTNQVAIQKQRVLTAEAILAAEENMLTARVNERAVVELQNAPPRMIYGFDPASKDDMSAIVGVALNDAGKGQLSKIQITPKSEIPVVKGVDVIRSEGPLFIGRAWRDERGDFNVRLVNDEGKYRVLLRFASSEITEAAIQQYIRAIGKELQVKLDITLP